MKPTTRKLSGPAMERLLRQVIVGEGVDDALAARLAVRLGRVLSSVRARRVPLKALRQTTVPTVTPSTAAPATVTPVAVADVQASAAPTAPPAKFDPYVFGLVPVFQREGRDGLLARLAGIGAADDLRAMARAQQIALEAPLKGPDVSLATLRDGIAAAVEKRIADRKAAAR
jgi:hypothetical protein